MRFQVPQFIEVEDKLFGPFTFKQFIYLAGGAGAVVALFTTLPSFFAFILSIPIVGLSLALTFFRYNNRPFIFMLESLFSYYIGEKLYIWKKEQKQVIKKRGAQTANPEVFIPKLSNSKLKDLSWSLDVTKNTAIDDVEDNIVSK